MNDFEKEIKHRMFNSANNVIESQSSAYPYEISEELQKAVNEGTVKTYTESELNSLINALRCNHFTEEKSILSKAEIGALVKISRIDKNGKVTSVYVNPKTESKKVLGKEKVGKKE